MPSLNKMSFLKSSNPAIDPFQFLRFLRQVLLKSGTPHFNIFEQQNAGEIFSCILDELSGNFTLALDLVQVKTRVTIHCLSCQQGIDNGDFFALFMLSVANTVQSTLDLFLTPEHLPGDNSFFCNTAHLCNQPLMYMVFLEFDNSL